MRLPPHSTRGPLIDHHAKIPQHLHGRFYIPPDLQPIRPRLSRVLLDGYHPPVRPILRWKRPQSIRKIPEPYFELLPPRLGRFQHCARERRASRLVRRDDPQRHILHTNNQERIVPALHSVDGHVATLGRRRNLLQFRASGVRFLRRGLRLGFSLLLRLRSSIWSARFRRF